MTEWELEGRRSTDYWSAGKWNIVAPSHLKSIQDNSKAEQLVISFDRNLLLPIKTFLVLTHHIRNSRRRSRIWNMRRILLTRIHYSKFIRESRPRNVLNKFALSPVLGCLLMLMGNKNSTRTTLRIIVCSSPPAGWLLENVCILVHPRVRINRVR